MWFSQCASNLTFMIITIVCGVAFYGLILLRTRSDASILTSSFVLLYCLYLQFSAMITNPNDQCNPFYIQSSQSFEASATTCELVLGVFFTIVALLIISSSTKKESEKNVAT